MLEHCLLWVNFHDLLWKKQRTKEKEREEERREGGRKAGRENVREESRKRSRKGKKKRESGKSLFRASQVVLAVKNRLANAGDSKRHGFNPWVGKMPWRQAWQLTPLYLPGESQRQRSLVGYIQGVAKSWAQLKRLSMQPHLPLFED